MRTHARTVLIPALMGLAIGSMPAGAAIRTWTGGVNVDWFEPGNWQDGAAQPGVPESGDTVVVNSGSVLLTNTTAELAAFTIANATLTFSNWTARLWATNGVVAAGGIINHAPVNTNAAPSVTNRIWIECVDFTLDSGGRLDAAALGHRHGQGAGAGMISHVASGAGYGGQGGRSSQQTHTGSVYGDAHFPDEPGSGGGNRSVTGTEGGHGGGAIRIDASGQVVLNGVIDAGGRNAFSTHGGGGSGGAIRITCATLAGTTGQVLANGGNRGGAAGNDAGGGGGRIAVHYGAVDSGLTLSFSAKPGLSVYPLARNRPVDVPDPHHGSVWFPDEQVMQRLIANSSGGNRLEGFFGHLIIDGGAAWNPVALSVIDSAALIMATNTTLVIDGDLNVTNAVVRVGGAGGHLRVGGDLRVSAGGELHVIAAPTNGLAVDYGVLVAVTNDLWIDDGGVVYPFAHGTDGGTPRFRVGGNMTVAAAGLIDALGRGFGHQHGHGKGQAGSRGAGGGYGGRGGMSRHSQAGGSAYGTNTWPILPGSGAGNAGGGHGGGLVRIESAGAIRLDGMLRADGRAGAGSDGAGSGGGILLVCDTFSGGDNASLTARGANHNSEGGGGGGGRISVVVGLGAGDRAKLRAGDPVDRLTPYLVHPDYDGQTSVTNGTDQQWTIDQGTQAHPGSFQFLGVPDPDTFNLEITASPTARGEPVEHGYGMHIGLVAGTVITNRVASPVDAAAGQHWSCFGWILADDLGNPAGSGASTQAVFTLATNLTLQWRWTNEYLLSVQAGPNGTTLGGGWFTNGYAASIRATADSGYAFLQWDGDIGMEDRLDARTTLVMDRPRSVTAAFASRTGQLKTWDGATAAWTAHEHWIPAGIPGTNDTVRIPAGSVLLATPQTVASMTVSNATLIFTNWTTKLQAQTVTLQNGALVTLPPAFTETQMSNRIAFACGDFDLYPGAVIQADARGFARGQGKGKGASGSSIGSGGGYGGKGGDSVYESPAVGGSPYGTAETPLAPGSGGGNRYLTGNTDGGDGGGAVWIEAAGRVTIDGLITANGGNGSGFGGGGSGGAMTIACHTFGGQAGGILRANGGDSGASFNYPGAGGGGRIAIVYQQLDGIPAVQVSTRIGAKSARILDEGYPYPTEKRAPEVGTLFFSTPALLDAIIDARGSTADGLHGFVVFGATNIWRRSSLNIVNATLGVAPDSEWVLDGNLYTATGGVVMAPAGGLTVSGDAMLAADSVWRIYSSPTNVTLAADGARVEIGGDMTVTSNAWVYPYSHSTDGGSVTFRMRNIDVEAGGGFNADGRGFSRAYGPGRGVIVAGIASGAGYGGRGGDNDRGAVGGAPYESGDAPWLPGSGGGYDTTGHSGGAGGGLIRIEAAGAVTIEGLLTANGLNGRSYGGGGSGGAIMVTAVTVGGQGVLRAAGGNSGGPYSGGGGGGRIAVWRDVPDARRRHYLAGFSGGMLRLDTFPGFDGTLSVANGTGYVNPPHPQGAYPGTQHYFIRRGSMLQIK